MKLLFKYIHFPAIVLLMVMLAGCSQMSKMVTPTVSQNEQNSTTESDPISESALAADQPASPAENVTAAQTQQQVQTASLDTSNAVTFLPVEGAPQGQVTALSKSIRKAAAEHNLAVLPASQTGSKYQVKGYFSALNDGSGTLLIYIWDIFDGSGNRLHRINGQERTSTTKSNPWQAISENELSRVADATALRIKSWVKTR